MLTPRDPARRGAMLSVVVKGRDAAAVQKAFGQNANAVYALHEIEERCSMAFGHTGKTALEREASQYARWALRTPRGRT